MRKMTTGSCGCEISDAKSQIGKTVFICSRCGQKCCGSHYLFKVDGNNIAISKTLFKHGICTTCLNNQRKKRDASNN